jgi:hypothetical protein
MIQSSAPAAMATTTSTAAVIAFFLLVAGAVADDGWFLLPHLRYGFCSCEFVWFGLCAGEQIFDQGWD